MKEEGMPRFLKSVILFICVPVVSCSTPKYYTFLTTKRSSKIFKNQPSGQFSLGTFGYCPVVSNSIPIFIQYKNKLELVSGFAANYSSRQQFYTVHNDTVYLSKEVDTLFLIQRIAKFKTVKEEQVHVRTREPIILPEYKFDYCDYFQSVDPFLPEKCFRKDSKIAFSMYGGAFIPDYQDTVIRGKETLSVKALRNPEYNSVRCLVKDIHATNMPSDELYLEFYIFEDSLVGIYEFNVMRKFTIQPAVKWKTIKTTVMEAENSYSYKEVSNVLEEIKINDLLKSEGVKQPILENDAFLQSIMKILILHYRK